MKVTLQKWGNSQGIRIPKTITEELNLVDKQTFNLIVKDNQIILKPENHSILRELFEGYDVSSKGDAYDFGSPKGKEIW